MFRTNALVLRVHGARVAGNFWETLVAYPTAMRSVLVLPEEPNVGDTLPEGVVTWVKPDDEKPGYFAVGIKDPTHKVVRKRTVFTDYRPDVGQWIEVKFL